MWKYEISHKNQEVSMNNKNVFQISGHTPEHFNYLSVTCYDELNKENKILIL